MLLCDPMDTESVLLELLGETETPLAQAEAEQVRASERVERLKAERYGLQLALARHRGEPEPARPTSAAAVDAGTVRHPTPAALAWRALNGSDAVERVVTEAGRPMNRNDIVARLTEAGREGDNPEN